MQTVASHEFESNSIISFKLNIFELQIMWQPKISAWYSNVIGVSSTLSILKTFEWRKQRVDVMLSCTCFEHDKHTNSVDTSQNFNKSERLNIDIALSVICVKFNTSRNASKDR